MKERIWLRLREGLGTNVNELPRQVVEWRKQ
jgi:hypothetical protein